MVPGKHLEPSKRQFLKADAAESVAEIFLFHASHECVGAAVLDDAVLELSDRQGEGGGKK